MNAIFSNVALQCVVDLAICGPSVRFVQVANPPLFIKFARVERVFSVRPSRIAGTFGSKDSEML
jgi:hypothetical protein